MLPKSHILLGTVFSLICFIIFPQIGLSGYLLILAASFLFDFDHYIVYVVKSKNVSLEKAYLWHIAEGKRELTLHKKGIRKRSYFHIFHTVEFHVLLIVFSLFYPIFLYLFLGLFFHSILDFIDLSRRDMIYRREFFFSNWLICKSKD